MCLARNYCDSTHGSVSKDLLFSNWLLMYLAWNNYNYSDASPCPPYISAQLQICGNFGQHFGQQWWMLVCYYPETVSTYGFEEGLNIGALPASGTTIKESDVPNRLKGLRNLSIY